MMSIYQRILAPIDGSTASACALREAIRLTDAQTQLRLIYVLDETLPLDAEAYGAIDYHAVVEAERLSGERALAQAMEKVRQSGRMAESAIINTTEERVAGAIGSEARRWRADLIVMGSHGRSGLSRLLMGSVAEDVTRHAPVPVLMVHAE